MLWKDITIKIIILSAITEYYIASSLLNRNIITITIKHAYFRTAIGRNSLEGKSIQRKTQPVTRMSRLFYSCSLHTTESQQQTCSLVSKVKGLSTLHLPKAPYCNQQDKIRQLCKIFLHPLFRILKTLDSRIRPLEKKRRTTQR